MKNELNFRYLKNFRGKYAPHHTTPTPHPHPHHTHTIKILRIFLSVGHPRDPKGENHGYLTTFRSINAPKSGPFKYKNKAQTLPKQVQNNFEKVQKSTFLTPKMVKNYPSNRPK